MKTYVLAENHMMAQFQGLPKKTKIMGSAGFLKQLQSERDSLWITEGLDLLKSAFSSFDEAFFKQQTQVRKHVAMIVLADDVPVEAASSFESLFKEAIILPQKSALPMDELIEILNGKHPERYVIGGRVDEMTKTVTLIRGDLSFLVVPFSTFRPSGNGLEPNFCEFSVDDYGQTVKLGEYEASIDAILYEFDSFYRRELKKERAKKDKSFGACLRRLRIQKGLRQTDFPGIDAREIGRIERNEVKPRRATIGKLAAILQVGSNEIEEY